MDQLNPFAGKMEELLKARLEKSAQVRESIARNEVEVAAARADWDNSIAGKLGFDMGGTAGSIANTVAATAAEGADALGAVAGGFYDAKTAALDMHIPDRAKVARLRQMAGKATEEDLKVLSAPAGHEGIPAYAPPMLREQLKTGNFETNQQRIEAAERSRDRSQEVRKTLSLDDLVARDQVTGQKTSGLVRRTLGDAAVSTAKGIVGLGEAAVGVGDIATLGLSGKGWEAMGYDPKGTHKVLDSYYSPEQRAANAKVQEAQGFLNTIEEGLDNPSTIAQGLIQSLPAMLGGGAIGKELLMQYPKVMELIGKSPALAALAEKLPALTQGGAAAIGEGTLMAGNVAEGIRQETDDRRLTLKQALLATGAGVLGAGAAVGGNKLARRLGVGDIDEAVVAGSLQPTRRGPITSPVLSTALESGEEAAQSAVETIAKNVALDKTYDEGLGNAVGMGVLTGGPMGFVGGLGSSVAADGKEEADKRSRQAKQKDAVATGNVDNLVDPASKDYDPARAVAALYGNSKQEGATEEAKQSNFEKASKIVSDLQERRDGFVKDLTESKAVQEAQAQLEAMKQVLAETDPADASLVAKRTELVKALEEEVGFVKADVQTQIDESNKQLKTAEQRLKTFNQQMQDRSFDAKAAAATIAGSDPVASQATAAKIINLAMATPERLDVATAKQLASDTGNGLTEAQRNYFRAFADARVAENLLKTDDDVSDNIVTGGKGYVGLNTYRSNMASALAGNNKRAADNQLKQLDSFATDHAAKAQVLNDAQTQYQTTRKPVQVLSDGNRGWAINTGTPLSDAEMRNGGHLTVDMRSGKLIAKVGQESKAITSTATELRAAYDHKFSPSQKETNDVKNESPAAGDQGTQERSAQEAPAEEGDTEGSSDAGQGATESSVQRSDAATADEGTSTTGVTEEAPASASTTTDEGQTQSTEEATTGDEQATEEVAVADVENETKVGLTVLSEQTSEEVLPANTKLGAVYRTINKAIAFLTQTKARIEKDADIAKDRPLVSVPNMLSRWNAGQVVPSDMFVDELMEGEFGALVKFQEFANKWSPLIRQNLSKGGIKNLKGTMPTTEFLFEDPLQDFFNKDGSVDENLVTAIAYGAYNFMVDSMNAPALKEPEDILKMHGLQGAEVTVSREGRRELATLVMFKDTAASAMGRYMTDALGLKVNDKAPADYMSKLQTAFGLQGLVLLAQDDVNMIDTVTVDGADLNRYMPGIDIQPNPVKAKSGKDVYPTITYVRVRREAGLQLPDDSKSIRDASVQSHGVIQRLFSSEHAGQYASWKPTKFSQQQAKKTDQNISKTQRRILSKAQQVPHRIIPAMWDALSVLGDDVILKAAGWTEYNEDRIQKENRESVQAKNMGLEDQLSAMKALVQDAIDNSPEKINQPFYATLEVWKNFRVGVATQNMNLQSSKIHRFMFTRPEWESTIFIDNEAEVEQLIVSLAQAFGLKIDQQPNIETMGKFMDMVLADDGRIQKMAIALAQALETPDKDVLTAVQKEEIAKFTADAEGMQTLQALVAYGQFENAKLVGLDAVKVNMLVGVDGKTNGPILTYLALGAEASVDGLFTQINRGGMYRESDGTKNYNDWYTRATSLDLYEDLASKILEGIEPNPELAAIYTFTKELTANGKVTSAGRNLAKTPLTSFIFGSSIDKSISNMQDGFVQSVFDRIEAVANGDDKKTTRLQIIQSLNTLMESNIPESASIEFLLSREFSEKEKAALANAFNAQLGSHVEETMKFYFETYLTRRNDINGTIQGAFRIYDAIYQDLRSTEIQRLMDEGEMDFVVREGKRVPTHEMTVAQEKVLRDKVNGILPLANTAYTVDDNELDAGLYMAKTRKGAGDQYSDKVKVLLGKLIPTGDNWRTNQMTGWATRSIETSPGVAGLPYFMHSLDSAVMHTSLEDTDTLNVHDEAGNGVNNVKRTATAINKATFDQMLNFSPATEAYEMLSRVITNAVAMIEAGEVSTEALAGVKEALRAQLPIKMAKKVKDANLPTVVIELANAAQFNANRLRLGALSEIVAMDQYTWEGGEYQTTEEDRAKAKEKLARLQQTRNVNPELAAAAEKLGAALQATRAKADPVVNEADKTSNARSVFGNVGPSQIRSDADLVEFFRANPQANARQVYELLMQSGRLNGVNSKLLKLISRVVNPDLSIRFITPQTAGSMVLDMPPTAARAWYVVKGNAKEIYVLSPEFESSGLTFETLLHELVHAAVAEVIDSPSADAKALVEELEALRKEAADYAQAAGLNDYAAALVDVQEFVAWGMTSQGFQRDVLSKISMQSKTRGNALVTGMQKFIDTLAKLLFKKPDQELSNGLNVLVSNVSGLFNEAAQQRDKPTSLTLAQATVAAVDRYTTMDIHQALDNGTVEPQFQQHLANLLSGIVESLHGPFGSFAAQMRKAEAGNPLAVWLKAMETGNAPFASSIVGSGFAGSAQEDHAMQQVEATVKAALDGSETTTKALYKELYELYTEMRDTLKPSDFASQEDYDFVFKIEADRGARSDYLARFAAMGLANQKFNSLLKVATEADTSDFGAGQTLMDRLANVFEKILAFFNEKLTHTFGGQQADEKLMALVSQLVDIEAKKRSLIKLRATEATPTYDIEQTVKGAVEYGREKLSELASSDLIKNSRFGTVRLAGTVTRLSNLGIVDKFMDDIRVFHDKHVKEKTSLGISMLNELRGPLQRMEELLRFRKKQEQQRKRIISQKAKQTLEMFINGGKDLGKEDKAALTNSLLRTGAHNLLGKYSINEIEQLLSDSTKRQQTIDLLTAQLPQNLRNAYVEQINGLGFYKATGKSRTPILMLNAHIISRLAGTKYEKKITKAEAAKAEDTIKQLIVLYTMRYLQGGDRNRAVQAMRTENGRTDGVNGAEFLMILHQRMEQESLERLFNNNPALMMHGYTPEITNPHTVFEVADFDRGTALMEQGYVKSYPVVDDTADPNAATKHIYVLKDGGLAPWLSGIFSTSDLHTKGTTQHNGWMNVNTDEGLDNAVLQMAITSQKLKQMNMQSSPDRNMDQNNLNYLVPVYNERGEITNWRYMMSDRLRDEILERDNSFDRIMGVFAGSVYDKQTSEDVNRDVIQALADQFDEDYETQPDSYVEVGPNAADPKMREIWALLSDASRGYVQRIWGQRAMMVRSDSLDIVFGYRKFSLAQAFMKEPKMRNDFERFTLESLEGMLIRYGRTPEQAANHIKKIGNKVAKGERMWQEIVREIKDIVVVKNFTTLMGNVYSNFSFLYAAGVPWKDILHHHVVAIKGTLAYYEDTARLAELETLMATGYTMGSAEEYRREIVRLRDLVDRNPVKKLMDAGLMPTIVEDVAQEQDVYSYKSLLQRKTEKYTDKLNPKVKEAGRIVYMAHDTKLYQLLSHATQMSDFVARYTLFQHLVARKEDPMSERDAMSEVSESFINYDIPMHRSMQYFDDMGIIPFTKYFLRIQRVLVKNFRKNPSRILSMAMLDHYMSLGPIVLDSSFAHHLGNNPIHGGALRFPQTLDELGTVKAAMALIK